jgi:hypothetical protein
MGQRDTSPPTHYVLDVEALLDEVLALTLPTHVLDFAARMAFSRGLQPREAAVRICHDHSRRLCQQLVDENEPASDFVELAVAHRIDGSAELASAMEQDLLDILPDLPDLIRQPCFSAEFRDTVAHIATWHAIPEHRWSASDAHAEVVRGAGT